MYILNFWTVWLFCCFECQSLVDPSTGLFIGELTSSRAPPVLTYRVIVRRRRPWKIQTVRRTWRCRRGGV